MRPLVAGVIDAAKKLDATLAGAKAARLQVWFFLAPLFTAFTVLAFRDSLALSTADILRIGFTNQCISFVVYAVTRPIVIRRSGRYSPLVLIGWSLTFCIPGEIFKGIQLGLPLDWQPAQPVFWLSLPTSCLVAAVWLTLSSLTVNWFASVRSVLGEMRAVEGQLIDNKQRLQNQLADDLQRLREQVTESLLPSLEKLRSRLLANRSTADSVLVNAASDIREFCDTEVRELSHRITDEAARIQTPPPVTRVGITRAILTVIRNGDVSLGQLFGIMLTLAIPYAIDSAGYQALLVTVVGLTVGFMVLKLIDPIRRRAFGNNGAASFASAFVMYLGISTIGVWLLELGLPLYVSLWDYVDTLRWLLPGILIFVWLVLGFAFGANDVVQLSVSRIQQTNRQLATENERLLTAGSATRNRIYRLLHGSVQGRLAAVSLALTAIVGEPSSAKREQLLKQANEQMALAEVDIRGAFDERDNEAPFPENLAALQNSWRNLMAIEMTVEPEALAALETSPFLSGEILAALQEGITNAHRHALASKVSIELVATEGQLALTIENDRRGEANDSADGTGIERIALGASSVKFDRGQDFAILTATWKLSD